jgi:hypothetical protein
LDTSEDLLRMCIDAMRKGADFPTVWQNVLRGHRLVLGMPEQQMTDGKAQLHIRLLTGQRIIFDSTSKTFSLR